MLTALSKQKRYWLGLVFLALVLYVLIPQLAVFRSSWRLLSHPDWIWVGLSVICIGTTYLAAAATYWWLTGTLRYWRTVLVQFGAMFINRLLPAGIGAIGTNFAYLKHERHQGSRATAIVALNNTLGLAGHGLLIVLAALIVPHSRLELHPSHFSHSWAWFGLAALVLMSVLALSNQRIGKAIRAVVRQMIAYHKRPSRLLGALSTSILLTLGNVLAFSSCCMAMGVHLDFLSALLIFTLGAGAGSAVPTPGGLGGFEAGLTAGLIAAGTDSSSALAAALLFRLVSYWLPLIPGAAALLVCQRRRLFGV